MNINDLVRYWGRTRPDHEAIVFNDTVLTWSEVDRQVDELARGLVGRGVAKGDRVSILMNNRPEVAVAMLASARIGAICAPLNFRLLGKELADMVEDCGPKVILVEEAFVGLLAESAQRCDFDIYSTSGSEHPSYDSLLVPTGDRPDVDVADDDPAFICYTSGTTGVQKGAVLTHRSILSVGEAAAASSGMNGDDRVLAAAPLVYTGSGISVFMQFVVYNGATMILLEEFDAERGLDAMVKHRVTAATMVPVIWERMAQLPAFKDLNAARYCFAGAGGAPVRLDLLERFRAQGIPLTQVYGLTEASGLASTMRYEDALERPGFAGLPLVGTDIRIAGENGGFAEPGEVGEILVRGPHVMQGYWGRPEATAEAIVDGWLRTGDLGLQDEDGFLKLVDRSKDMLISGGLNVYPAEIERALAGIPGVSELAVIGVPDEEWGEVPMVVVTTSEDAEAVVARISEASQQQLARFKQPRHAVVSVEPLPRTFSGKLAKPVLRKQYPIRPESAVPLAR